MGKDLLRISKFLEPDGDETCNSEIKKKRFKVQTNTCKFREYVDKKLYRGYYMVLWRYEISLLMLKHISRVSENFVSPRGHVPLSSIYSNLILDIFSPNMLEISFKIILAI